MKIVATSGLVDDQEKALRFYTDVLAFVKNQDAPSRTSAPDSGAIGARADEAREM